LEAATATWGEGEVVMEMVTDFPQQIKEGIQIYIGEKKQDINLFHSATAHCIGRIEDYCCDAGISFSQPVVYGPVHIGPLPDGLFFHRGFWNAGCR
jgi:hypothetical protein